MYYQTIASTATDYVYVPTVILSWPMAATEVGVTSNYAKWMGKSDSVSSKSQQALTIWTDHNSALFRVLKLQWHKERKSTSSTSRIVMCPAYQQIIGMGDAAVPLIMKELQDNLERPDHWFWALSMITRADPIPVEMYGKHVAMAKAWIAWGEEHKAFTFGQSAISPTYLPKMLH